MAKALKKKEPLFDPNQTYILLTLINGEIEYQFLKLASSHAPWAYRINKSVLDGKNYNRQGEKVLVSYTNFLIKDDADKRWKAISNDVLRQTFIADIKILED